VTDERSCVIRFSSADLDDWVEITIRGRQFPAATDYWDGNWLVSPIEVHVGCFRAVIDAAQLRTNELQWFRDQLGMLYERNDGEAGFASLDGWMSIDVKGDGTGHLVVTGTAADQVGTGHGNTLEFELRGLDQTFHPHWLSALDEALLRFPVLEPRTGP
jgi:hypothetical protein